MGTLIGAGGHGQDIWHTLDSHEWRWINHHDDWDGTKPVILAINDPQTRALVADKLHVFDRKWIHPSVHEGIRSTVALGTHINYGVMMTRTRIGVHCTIGPGVHMAGDITIGDRVFIGIGATIGNLITIGDDAIIGAGSVVLKDVPAGKKVLGVWA